MQLQLGTHVETSKIYHQTILSPHKYNRLLLLNESRSETETTSSCATETCIKICQINRCHGQVLLKSLLTRLIESTITGIGKVYEVELMKMLYLYLNKITFSSIKVACYCFFWLLKNKIHMMKFWSGKKKAVQLISNNKRMRQTSHGSTLLEIKINPNQWNLLSIAGPSATDFSWFVHVELYALWKLLKTHVTNHSSAFLRTVFPSQKNLIPQ